MKRAGKASAAALAICLIFPAGSFAARASQDRGWGAGFNGAYDKHTEETLSGTVEDVEQVIPMRGMSKGVHLVLKTDKETVAVHLGPAWYIDSLDMKVSKGDRIEVRGSRVDFRGKPAIIASEVSKDGKAMRLRDENGLPLWPDGKIR